MIQESFLHFIWQNQYFNTGKLFTQFGDPLIIESAGVHNGFAGPDFKEAKIRINDVLWAGAVEIHIRSSDWYAHGHQKDANYENVVLHVIYELDKKVVDRHGNELPSLELKGLIKPKVFERYQRMLEASHSTVNCSKSFSGVKPIVRLGMLEKALISRLEAKSVMVRELLEENNFSWEETAYQWLARGFGFKANAAPMLSLAKSVPSRLLRKHHDLKQIEALLFGASGLLNIEVKSPYLHELKEEYLFLKAKYDIKEKTDFSQWHFARVRPGNYPTTRIAQFAALLCKHQNIFTLFTEFENAKTLEQKLTGLQPSYWQTHYMPDKKSKKKISTLTPKAKYNLLINTTAPLLAAFAKQQDKTQPLEKALNLLSALPAEENHITREWKTLGWNVSSAFDSQGLIQLYNEYCSKKRCIECNIGVSIVRA